MPHSSRYKSLIADVYFGIMTGTHLTGAVGLVVFIEGK
jgi:hypothetical protein